MLRIRFKRAGKKHQPSYRLVVSERARTPFAKAKEDIGWYNPHSKEAGVDKERAKYWLSVGAQPSSTVHNLFVKEGVMDGKKIAVHSQPKKSEEDVAKDAEAAKVTEAPIEGEASASAEEVQAETPQPEADAPQAQAEEVKEESVEEEVKEEVSAESDKPLEEAPAEEPKES